MSKPIKIGGSIHNEMKAWRKHLIECRKAEKKGEGNDDSTDN